MRAPCSMRLRTPPRACVRVGLGRAWRVRVRMRVCEAVWGGGRTKPGRRRTAGRGRRRLYGFAL